jgi:hypothetical protein
MLSFEVRKQCRLVTKIGSLLLQRTSIHIIAALIRMHRMLSFEVRIQFRVVNTIGSSGDLDPCNLRTYSHRGAYCQLQTSMRQQVIIDRYFVFGMIVSVELEKRTEHWKGWVFWGSIKCGSLRCGVLLLILNEKTINIIFFNGEELNDDLPE